MVRISRAIVADAPQRGCAIVGRASVVPPQPIPQPTHLLIRPCGPPSPARGEGEHGLSPENDSAAESPRRSAHHPIGAIAAFFTGFNARDVRMLRTLGVAESRLTKA